MDKRGKRLRGSIVVVLLIIATIVTAMPSLMGYANTTRMNLKGSYNNKEEAIYLDWDTPNQSEPYTYQMFSKKPDTDEFQSISASNLDLDKVVKALNVFPVNHVSMAGSNYIPKKDTNETDLEGKPLYRSAMLKEWIGEFGHGKIEVDAINQNDFDANPEKYLKDEEGNYKYDVVAVGFWNINQGQNHFLGDNGMKHLRDFAESGRGIMTGHHHIALRELDKGMNKLKDLFGIKFLGEDGWNQHRDTYYDKPVEMDYTSPHKSVSPHNSRFWATGDEVVASKRGLLLEYPNYVAQEGRVFDIPLTHNGGDYVTGDVWLEFTNPMSYRTGVPLENPEQLPDGTRGSTNSYLSTYNNTALIQTGHSSLTGGHLYSTEDEKMLVANTIFYLAQLTQDTNLVDRSAMDIYPPYFVNDVVDVNRTDNNIRVSFPDAIDPTKEFEYYVKATGQDTGVELQSETIKVPQTTGVEGYSYVMDNKPDTVPDNKIETKSRTINIPNDRNQGEFLHISAVDGVGNVSKPIHIDLRETYYKVEGNVFDDVNFNGVKDEGEGNIPNLTVTLEDDKGNPLTDLKGDIYTTKTDKNGNYSFGMYTGGNMRVKFDSVTDKLFTVKIDGSGGGAIQNHVVEKMGGATDVFSLNQNQPNIKRNAGLTQRESYFRNLHLGVKGYYDKEVDGIHVDWNVPDDEEPYIYQVYSKKPEHEEFQTVSTTDLDLEVRVLNVHPDRGEMINYTTWDGTKRTVSKSASLEMWMEEPNSEHSKGYGMGVIDVTPVTMSEFNANPDKYLKDNQGEYKYDVMFVGTWDANGRIGFDKNATDKVEEFIDSGRGILAGHDTLGYIESSQYFRTLADKFNLDPLSGSTRYIGHTEVVIDKRGLLTNYPWNIGEVGTKLTVPHTHTLRQIVNGDVWLRFTGSSGVHAGAPQSLLDDPLQNSYLTSWNNTAMIQTGHSDAEATPDEQKILANTLFYLSQRTYETGITDNSAMDTYEPEFNNEETSVKRTNEIIEVNFPKAEDQDKQFDYYVKAIGEGTGIEVTSETIQVNQISGVEGYSYVMDNSPNTKPNNKVDLKETTLILPNDRSQRRYLHISAVDYQGNVSEPLHIDLSESYYRVDGNLFMDLDGNGVRTSEEPWIENHEVSLVGIYGEQLKDLNGEPYKTVTDSNGYYRFDVYTGGRLRLKVEPIEDRRFTSVPDNVSDSSIYNQITNPIHGLTDIFEVGDIQTKVTRNAGFTFKELNYTVEHVNQTTGNIITERFDGVLDGIEDKDTEIIPLTRRQIPEGYTYNNRYKVNGGESITGDSFILEYYEYTREVTITFYYTFDGMNDTTKRFQGDGLGSPLPIDSYTNAGIYTKRGVNGEVIDTGMNVNSTFVIDEYEAPIAMIPRSIDLQIIDDNGDAIHTENKSLGNNNTILNTSYLEGLRVQSRFGDSEDANSTSERVDITNYQEPTYKRIDIKSSGMKGTSEVREVAITDTNATLGANEDVNYVGRWVNQPLEMTYWTPEGIGGISTSLTGEDSINRANTIQTSYEIDIYNILQHNYEARVGSDDVEYYQYTGSTLRQGYFPYNSTGEQSGAISNRDTSVVQSTYVDVRDIEVGSYVNAEGFSVNNNQITPIQRQVATEVIDDGGQTITGHQTDSVSGGGINPVEEGGSGYNPQDSDDRAVINYYEELAYVPYTPLEDELITQQAVPVGGRIHYVDPYDYVVLPSYNQLTVNEESGKLITDIQANAEQYYNTGNLHSEVEYTEEHSGVYVSDVDDYTSFEQTIPDATSQNKQHMDSIISDGNEVNPNKYNETPNYEEYVRNAGSSEYLPEGAVQASTQLDYRLPLMYSHNTKEMILKDVVAVGQDTGYPVYGHPDIIGEVYRNNYLADFGVEPSITDKLITANRGSIYLIPLNNQGQTLEDEYQVREYINSIGTSQVSVVNDKTYTVDKYLYGRGDNTIYSGKREEVEVEDNFTADQMIRKDDSSKETKRVNGIRTGNNKKINKEILEEDN